MRMISIVLSLLFCVPSFADTSFGVWSEWIPYPSLQQRLPWLSQHFVRLHVAVREDEYQDPVIRSQLVELFKDAKSKNVEVWLWPLLSKKNGYWFNQWNSEFYSDYTHQLIHDLEAEGVRPAGVSMDLEPPPEVLASFLDLVSHFKIKKLLQESKKNVDLALFNKMQERVSELSKALHLKGIKTHAVTTPFVLEDPRHDQIVQKIFGIPLQEKDFDYISFMAYRSEYERILGKMNPRVVYEYSKRSKQQFGDKAAIDLGVVGDISYPHEIKGYKKPSELWKDISAAKAGGIDRIQVYALDGMNEENWFEDVPAKKPMNSIKFGIMDRLIHSLILMIQL